MTIGHDALGRRVETVEYWNAASNSAMSTPRHIRHVFDGLQTIEEHVCDSGVTEGECDSPGWSLARAFVWGDSGRFPEPVAMIDYTGLGLEEAGEAEVFHYLHDALGSVIGLTDADGELVERYTYDPYGRTYIENPSGSTWIANGSVPILDGHGATTPAYSAFGNPFMWTGQRFDSAIGLYHFHFRTYSPALGRWLQRDPIGQAVGLNLYEYVLSNPTGILDSLGLSPKSAEGKALLEELKKLCDKGCNKECSEENPGPTSQGCEGKKSESSQESQSQPAPTPQTDCEKDCKTDCYKEADELATLVEETLEDCKIGGNCLSLASILNKVFSNQEWSFFEMGSIRPIIENPEEKPRAHVVTTIGLKSDRFGETNTELDGKTYRDWEVLIDPVKWNHPSAVAEPGKPWRPHIVDKNNFRDIHPSSNNEEYHPFGPPAKIVPHPHFRDRKGRNPWRRP